jgi:DNA-binding transcriptional LysR family regulator
MEIRHLITFMTIVEIGSYTGAASKLGYTQSTITSHIQALEHEIGGELFTYVKRNLQLSPIGRELIPLAEDLLSTHEQIKNMRSTQEVKGVLKVAAPESLTISRIGPIIREYSLKYPHVKIVLTNGTCGQNQIDLISGKVDVAFMVYPDMKPEKCLHYSLFEEKIVLVSSNEGLDHFDEYKNHTNHFFITNEEGCSYRTMFERYLVKNDLHHFQTMELWSIEAIKKIVMSGLGFSVLPYVTIKEEVDCGKLKIINHNEQFEPFYSHMLIKKKKWLSPAVESFVEVVLNSTSLDEKELSTSYKFSPSNLTKETPNYQ